MINVNAEKCIGCGNCIDKCICSLLSLENSKIIKADGWCLKCLHCAAACPNDVFLIDDKPAAASGDLPKLPEDFDKNLEILIKTRRSYRNFSEKKVPLEKIERALHLSDWAPSAKNEHKLKYYVIDGRDTINEIMDIILKYIKEAGICGEIIDGLSKGVNMIFTTAQTAILCTSYAKRKPQTDAAIALTHAELFLQSQGVGTCWAGYLTTFMEMIPQLRDYLKIPEKEKVYGGLLVGYPTEKYYRIPERAKKCEITVIKK